MFFVLFQLRLSVPIWKLIVMIRPLVQRFGGNYEVISKPDSEGGLHWL